jgi:hypothetical protein
MPGLSQSASSVKEIVALLMEYENWILLGNFNRQRGYFLLPSVVMLHNRCPFIGEIREGYFRNFS